MKKYLLEIIVYTLFALFFGAIAYQAFSPVGIRCHQSGGEYFLVDGCVPGDSN